MATEMNRSDFLKTIVGGALASGYCASPVVGEDSSCCSTDVSLIRTFGLPVPLYAKNSVRRQDASHAARKPCQDRYVYEMYSMLRGHEQNYLYVNHLEFTIPIFAASTIMRYTELEVRTYYDESWSSSTLRNQQEKRLIRLKRTFSDGANKAVVRSIRDHECRRIVVGAS
ncbi:hypothetical protein Poly21_28210 [Allorhodopirellula heiligendammensis]|uniref:Uncharacterized protein n=1 Tax=Allorhodopirellula heiligendammensis TaxID=2714739 RepID=A0A5C6BXS7_9BACT|nr:hypothetical protein Poly21_28210 [Allorhodopirellula heiligendammensis]